MLLAELARCSEHIHGLLGGFRRLALELRVREARLAHLDLAEAHTEQRLRREAGWTQVDHRVASLLELFQSEARLLAELCGGEAGLTHCGQAVTRLLEVGRREARVLELGRYEACDAQFGHA